MGIKRENILLKAICRFGKVFQTLTCWVNCRETQLCESRAESPRESRLCL